MLIDGIELNGSGVDPLISREEPAIDIGTDDLSIDGNIRKGTSGQEAVGGNTAEIASIAIAALSNAVMNVGVAAPEGRIAEAV